MHYCTVCGGATFVPIKDVRDLQAHGIKVLGRVVEERLETSRLNDGSTGSGVFLWIAYSDASGNEYKIRQSLAKPLSRRKINDVVEVIYPARHPESGIVNSWNEFYVAPLFFGLITLAWFGLLFPTLRWISTGRN